MGRTFKRAPRQVAETPKPPTLFDRDSRPRTSSSRMTPWRTRPRRIARRGRLARRLRARHAPIPWSSTTTWSAARSANAPWTSSRRSKSGGATGQTAAAICSRTGPSAPAASSRSTLPRARHRLSFIVAAPVIRVLRLDPPAFAGSVQVQNPPAHVGEPGHAPLPGDELAVEHEPCRQLPQLGQDGRHVPPTTTPNTQPILRRHDCAEAVPLELEGPAGASWGVAGRDSMGSGNRRRETLSMGSCLNERPGR